MTIFLSIIHVLVCLFLILIVLAQQGKGQDLASAFGGGGGATAFGARGTATLLSKVTAIAAIIFMVTSLGLTYLRPAVSGKTVVPDEVPAVEEAPAVPFEEPTPPGEAENPSAQDEPTSGPEGSNDKGKAKPPSQR